MSEEEKFTEDQLLDQFAQWHKEANLPPTINDPRVVEASGGGMLPEQHFGTLINGDRFYLRTRHGNAQLHVASAELCEQYGDESWISGSRTKYPPISNPDYDFDEAVAARQAGKDFMPFWLDRVAEESLPNGDFGAYNSPENRDASFKRLLDKLWEGDDEVRGDINTG